MLMDLTIERICGIYGVGFTLLKGGYTEPVLVLRTGTDSKDSKKKYN